MNTKMNINIDAIIRDNLRFTFLDNAELTEKVKNFVIDFYNGKTKKITDESFKGINFISSGGKNFVLDVYYNSNQYYYKICGFIGSNFSSFQIIGKNISDETHNYSVCNFIFNFNKEV